MNTRDSTGYAVVVGLCVEGCVCCGGRGIEFVWIQGYVLIGRVYMIEGNDSG